MHGADLRWLVVFKRCRLTYPWKVIEEELHIPISSQKRIVACYEMTGQVFRRSIGLPFVVLRKFYKVGWRGQCFPSTGCTS